MILFGELSSRSKKLPAEIFSRKFFDSFKNIKLNHYLYSREQRLFFAILSARPKLFIVNCPLSIDLSFSNRTEELHLLLNGRLDSLCARCEELSWVKALANKILALFDVLSCCCLERKLTLCVYVDL